MDQGGGVEFIPDKPVDREVVLKTIELAGVIESALLPAERLRAAFYTTRWGNTWASPGWRSTP